ncbi:MAG: beta-ketoacyl-ACP synthase II [Ignavibacteriaceae bacterium]|nr:beta-ketoacyl-ACP synthase II [Ignavibacteriaceae bacterium]
MMHRVVITGMGCVTPIGNSLDDFWNALLCGENGVAPITHFDASKYDTQFAAEIKNFDPLNHIDKKTLKRIDPFTIYALSAVDMAVKNSQLDFSNLDQDRAGVIFGSGIGGIKTLQSQTKALLETGDPKTVSPFFVTMMIADIVAGYISIHYGLKGPNYCTTSACATSSHSIADAFMLIQRGTSDVMICGGSEASITELGIAGFNAMRAISTWNDRYLEASRPFDKDRNGFVMGEGSGALVLEEMNHAINRGANIYAEIAGIGLTADAFHITAPDPEGRGAQKAMKNSIYEANISLNDIDYINAHGTSTPLNDVTETKAIKSVFGDHAKKLTVSSIKSMTGHLLGAAGGVEAIATVLSIKNDIIPPTINLTNPDPECDLDYSANTPTKRIVNAAISNTFGFGGHNASLLFKKFTP